MSSRGIGGAAASAMIVAGLVLAGCLPTSPGRVEAYQGLTASGQAPGGAAGGFPIAGRGRSIGVLATASTEKQMEYLAEAVKQVRTSPLLRSHYRADLEAFAKPSYLYDTATSQLRQRFGRVVQINDLSEAAARRLDYVALLDLKASLPTPMNFNYSYELSLDILDAQQRRIGTIRGAGSEPMGQGCFGWGDAVIDCGVNANISAIRKTADDLRASFAASVR